MEKERLFHYKGQPANRPKVTRYLERATAQLIDRFDQSLGCWTYGDIRDPANAERLTSAWTTAETLFHLLASTDFPSTDRRAVAAIRFIDSDYCEEPDSASGGWRIYPHIRSPFIEATAWCCRVLARYQPSSPRLEAGVFFLLAHQNEDGGLGSVAGDRSRTYATSVAALALLELLASNTPTDRKALTAALEPMLDWITSHFDRRTAQWPTSATEYPNPASTGHALLVLTDAAITFRSSRAFLFENAGRILDAMLGGAQGGRWAREIETYTFQDHGSLEIRRAIWNATNFGLLGSYRLARSFDVLDEYLARLLEIESTILRSIELPRQQPLFEVAQGLYVIAQVSPALEAVVLAERLKAVTHSQPVSLSATSYASVRFGALGLALSMALVVVAAAFPVHGLRVASFVLAIGAFVFLNAATEPARLERWLAAYRVRLIVLFGASIAALAFTAKHFLASMFAWFGMSPEQGTSSFGSLLFTIGLLAQQHFAERFVLLMKPRQIRSELPHDRIPMPPP